MSSLDAAEVAARLAPRRRAEITAGRNGWSLDPWPELDAEAIVLLDGPLGLVSPRMDERDIGLVVPSGTALAATWDTSVVRSIGEVLGARARQQGVHVILGPNLNLPRLPRSGRTFEMFSEDPLLTGVVGAAWIEGVQQQGVAACAKHLICNDTEAKRQVMNAEIGEVRLREVYLLPFEHAARAGVWTMLLAYNRFRGAYCAEQPVLTAILRDEWAYDGVVMSDWFGTHSTEGSAAAGLDLEMPGRARFYGSALADAIEAGIVDQGVADRAATNLMRLAGRVGTLGAGETAPALLSADPTETLRAAAAAGTVLLRNEGGVLPIAPSADSTIAILGPNAFEPCYQGGTFARVNLPADTRSPVDVLRESLAPARIVTARGTAHEGLLPLLSLDAQTPTGDTGLLVEYFFPGEETSAASEIRPGSAFVWFNDIPGLGGPAQAGRIRVSGTVRSAAAKSILLHVGGTGSATLALDGRRIAAWDRPDPVDIMGVVARAETIGAPIELSADTAVEIVAEFDLEPGRVQAVTLGWTEPVSSAGIAEAVRLAAEADTVILFVGDEVSSSRESADRSSTALPPAQLKLIDRVAAVAKQLVIVVNASRAVDLSWSDRADAVLLPWFGGAEMSTAISDVLVGARTPDGRLPITIAERDEDYPGWAVHLDADD
ncbi:MAG: glycoside hydrolase family 3 C-terminal domain-containing protein, partial [Pseudolysinimonas sp.]